MEEEKKEN
jgi:hypothetical protein